MVEVEADQAHQEQVGQVLAQEMVAQEQHLQLQVLQ
jgi:hypothetical protein